jgi:cytochrome P450
MTALVYPQTVATVSNFLLAMVQHPEVLAKAQEEVDRVVGTERLPSFQDREYLPYGKNSFQDLPGPWLN